MNAFILNERNYNTLVSNYLNNMNEILGHNPNYSPRHKMKEHKRYW